MFKAILFDMDDLMVNSAPLHIEASDRVFKKLGADVKSLPKEMVAGFYGKRIPEIIQFTMDHFGITKVPLNQIVRIREEIFLELIDEKLEPMPGLFTLVSRIGKTKLKTAVASSGNKVYIKRVLKKFGLEKFFKAIASGDMVENGKPSPDVFLKAAELVNVSPEHCIVLEDAKLGIDAAKSAGMFCVGVINPDSTYEQDLSRADIVVKRLDEIDLNVILHLRSS